MKYGAIHTRTSQVIRVEYFVFIGIVHNKCGSIPNHGSEGIWIAWLNDGISFKSKILYSDT